MKTAIIVSKKDIAGMNIKERLLELFNFNKLNEKFDDNSVFELDNKIKLYTIETDTIYSENLDKKIDADLFIFTTRHSSKEKVPSLSCHVPGNWSKAEFGGKDKELCIAPAILLRNIFLELNNQYQKSIIRLKNKNNNVQVTLECTHHGPYLEKPCCFVEIGSSEEFWRDKKLGGIVSKTIINSLNKINKDNKIAFGIGGPHYCNNFNKVVLRTDIAIGHICPKYALQNLDGEMILQAIEKTQEKVDFVLLDWKGLGQYKQKIVDLLKELNIKYERTDKF